MNRETLMETLEVVFDSGLAIPSRLHSGGYRIELSEHMTVNFYKEYPTHFAEVNYRGNTNRIDITREDFDWVVDNNVTGMKAAVLDHLDLVKRRALARMGKS